MPYEILTVKRGSLISYSSVNRSTSSLGSKNGNDRVSLYRVLRGEYKPPVSYADFHEYLKPVVNVFKFSFARRLSSF